MAGVRRVEDQTRRLLATAAASAAFAGLLGVASPAAAKDCAELAGAALPDGKVTSATLVPAGGFQMPASPT